MPQPLVQLQRRRTLLDQPPSPPIPVPQELPSTAWIYRMKMKAFAFHLFYACRSSHPWMSLWRNIIVFCSTEEYRARQRVHLEGECNRCGHCCRLLFDCPFLGQGENGTTQCTIYLTRHAPKVCVMFPLNPQDLAEIKRAIAPHTCSFSFQTPATPPPSPSRFSKLFSTIRKILFP